MRWFGKKTKTPANTDLQTRLDYIADRANDIKKNAQEGSDVEQLAYLVSYLSGIMKKHFQTDER